MNMALISLLAVVLVFVIGAFKKNPLHLGILALFFTYFLGKAAGLKDVAIMGFFPTTLFVRVFGIMLFFCIAQINGSLELLAKKMLSKTGTNAKLMPFFIFYVGVILGALGIDTIAGMAILSGIGIALAVECNGRPMLFGIAGGYGIACGAYSPINAFSTYITSSAEESGLDISIIPIFLYALVTFSVSMAVIYFLLGGHKAKGSIDKSVLSDLPNYTKEQKITIVGILAVLLLVVLFKIDVGFAGIIVAVVLFLLGCCKCEDAVKKVSISSLMLICGVGTLIGISQELGGFELLGTTLASVMNETTAPPLMALTSAVMSLFSIARLCVITLVPTIPGILEIVPNASAFAMVAATSIGAFSSCIGPLSTCGALVMQNLGQQFGEEEAQKEFTNQMMMGVVGAGVAMLSAFIISLIL